MAAPTAAPFFHEEQAFRDRRLRLAVAMLPLLVTLLVVARVVWPGVFARLPATAFDLGFFAVLLWIVYAWLLRVRLVVEVGTDGLTVRLRGLFWRDHLSPGAWTGASPIAFDAAREFGGWGLRQAGALRAYVANGTTGVKLDLAERGALVVGSARPSDLLAALDRAARRR